MVFILGVVLAFSFLDWPGRIAVIAVLGAVEVFEVALWLKLRRLRSMTGQEGLVGARGRALTNVRPEGQVKVRGTIWGARSTSGVNAGDEVVVTATEGIRLQVERA